MSEALKMGPEDLEVDRLLVVASEVAGLEDYGDRTFVEALTAWVDSLVADATLNSAGYAAWCAEFVHLLVNRLRFEDDLKKHPEILEEDVSDPIVVVGLPRTGTTKLQRVMSADPGVQKLAYWRLANPAPFPDADPQSPDPRLGLAYERLDALQLRDPELAAGHFFGAEEAEEDLLLLQMSFECLVGLTRSRCPSYVDWWLSQPRHRPYDYLRRLVQYLQWQDRGRRGRPWVLKSPAHVGNLDVVFDTFPKATVVHCHRDPKVAMGSSMKLMEVAYRQRTDQINMDEIGDSLLSFFADEMNRNLDQREHLAEDQRVLDAPFADICDDPVGVIRKVHEVRGNELPSESAACMTQWNDENPQHKHGKFEYRLEDYGVTPERVATAFARYLDRFGTDA